MSWLRFVACGSLGTSVFSYKRKNLDIATLAQNLNAANILKGSVRTPGKRVRITAQFAARDSRRSAE